jgi:tetratricopeptide (TPR) repeat protein
MLMIVSNTVTTVLDCVPLAGADLSTAGMSPANAVDESTHASATDISNRFMDFSPLGLRRCKNFYIEIHETRRKDFLQGSWPITNIPFAFKRLLTFRKTQLLMRTASPKPDISHLPANEQARFRCQTALELKDKGDYEGAQEVMRPLWKRVGERPDLVGLYPSVAAEVLLCVGILTRWIGSRNEVKEANDWARDLITESITYFESIGDSKRVAAARVELAYCYWKAGALDEARIMFTEALPKLTTEGNTRANALFGLSVVEWSASRYGEALAILTDNERLFRKISNHTIKGAYHHQLGMVLRKLATAENESAQLRRVLNEYEEADRQFKLAHNPVYRAIVKNNIGNALRELSRFKQAHEYLDHARRLTVSLKDKIKTAQVDESRAQLFIKQRRFTEAEAAARHAARTLEKGEHRDLLAEALTTHGVALARLGKTVQAQFSFQKAIEVAHQAGALSRAGIAALTLIEEIDDLSPELLSGAYQQAGEWLAECQSQELLLRFKAAGTKLALKLREGKGEDAPEALFIQPRNFKQDLLDVERKMIRKALAEVSGSVTRAAALLGMSYQGLAYLIQTRHKELLKDRTPVVRRRYRKDQ